MFGLPDDIVEAQCAHESVQLPLRRQALAAAQRGSDQVQVENEEGHFFLRFRFMACASEMTGVREAMESCATIKAYRASGISAKVSRTSLCAATFLLLDMTLPQTQ